MQKICPRWDSNPWPLSLARKRRQRCDSNAVSFFDRKLLIDLADFQYQTMQDICASCIKIWRKSDKNCDRESAATRKCKMAAMTSSNSKFQKPRKMTLANILEIICVKFHQNRFICLGCRDDTDRQTHRRTHTHTLGSIATYSVKMTEYKTRTTLHYRSLKLILVFVKSYFF